MHTANVPVDDLGTETLQYSIMERGADGKWDEHCSVNIESLAYFIADSRRKAGRTTRVIDNHA